MTSLQFVTRLLFGWSLLLAITNPSFAKDTKILKVLPHLADWQGRIALAPSLYERDAYQLQLRGNPGEVGSLRFDVQWQAAKKTSDNLELRVETRGSKTDLVKPLTFKAQVKKPRHFSKWSQIRLDKAAYQQLGELIAWRVTLWDGEKQIAEQQSFLW